MYLRHLSRKLGITIDPSTSIGPGLYIAHYPGTIINSMSVLGKNSTLSPGIVLGLAPRGKCPGSPVFGDNVYVAPGAKVFGGIHIGNNVAIGANCVVTHDVPDNAVVVGIPEKILSYDGSKGFVNNIDYEDIIVKP
jgi:serine O-acetyltransferase